MPTPPFRILTICTGNICRSPAADLLLAARLGGDPRFAVGSAGTHAMTGWPISSPMDELLGDLGVASADFVARQATARMLAEADLILTATREHRQWVVQTEPRTVRRAFMLTEFADIVAGQDGSQRRTAADLVVWAGKNRPRQGVVTLGAVTRRGYQEGDILDPYGRGRAAYVSSLAQIEPVTATISAALLATD